jgi:biotin operon repressor
MEKCEKCGRQLKVDEVSLYIKLVDREPKSFLCIDCLASKMKVTREMLEKKIEYFREIGCTLFS